MNIQRLMDPNWICVGTCGNCGGPVKTPQIWDENGTITGSPRPQYCIACGKEPKTKAKPLYGPVLEMK